jgi:hypothetical protein
VALLRRAALVVVLSGVAIEVHELGHRAVFWLTGTPVRMGFQRVDPTVPVSHALWLWVAGVYAGSLAVGMGAVILDDLLGIHGR